MRKSVKVKHGSSKTGASQVASVRNCAESVPTPTEKSEDGVETFLQK